MKKIMLVFGTRPEAIKMCPLVLELKKNHNFDVSVCVTGQHRQMLDQVLSVFNLTPDYDLSIMRQKQTLFDVTINILEKMRLVLQEKKPDIVLVHGDTTTAYVTSLVCFYMQIIIGHVEAGLRTYDLYSPFPEEFNRRSIDMISNIWFAPTDKAKENLLKENVCPQKIFVTGNTGIDALRTTIDLKYQHPELEWAGNQRLILVTVHRRENLGLPMKNIFKAIKRVCDDYEDVKVIYPLHLNPAIRESAYSILGNSDRIHLIEPLDVIDFHNFMNKAYLILTDSGGIQEEAPSLGKPVLVVREETERPEGVEAGTLKLIGTKEDNIYKELSTLLSNPLEYKKMGNACNPYGDGYASKKISQILEAFCEAGNE